MYPGKAWTVESNNRITGFALGRVGNKYNQIGPVVASKITDTKILITKALDKLIDQSLVVDVLFDKEDLENSVKFKRGYQTTSFYQDVLK